MLEFGLYVEDVPRAVEFYEGLLTVESEVRWEEGGRSIYFRDSGGTSA